MLVFFGSSSSTATRARDSWLNHRQPHQSAKKISHIFFFGRRDDAPRDRKYLVFRTNRRFTQLRKGIFDLLYKNRRRPLFRLIDRQSDDDRRGGRRRWEEENILMVEINGSIWHVGELIRQFSSLARLQVDVIFVSFFHFSIHPVGEENELTRASWLFDIAMTSRALVWFFCVSTLGPGENVSSWVSVSCYSRKKSRLEKCEKRRK